jgi:RimJ/RimL family protein N-acetyltransferase
MEPVTLTGRVVRLEPLSLAHAPGLWKIASEPEIWQYIPYGDMDSPERMQAWVEEMLRRRERGTDLPFAVIHLESGQVAGATRYMTAEPHNRSLEIGGTWYGRDYRRTAVNTECKYLLLKHAFETLGYIRVQFRTDLRNIRSQQAIERIGAVKEAVFRKYSIMPDGHQRSSVFYSIVDQEWPSIKQRLEEILGYG